MIIAVIVLITLVVFAVALIFATTGPRETADVATKLYAVRCQIASALLRAQVRADATHLRRELNRQFEELDNRRPRA